MGCGLSSNTTEQDETKEHPSLAIANRRLSQSVARLEEISQDRVRSPIDTDDDTDNLISGETFEFGDFAVSVVPRPNSAHRHGRRASIGKIPKPARKKSAFNKPAPTDDANCFRFGDFIVSLESELEDEIVNKSMVMDAEKDFPSLPTMENLSTIERQIHGFDQYNLLGHSTRVKCIALSPNEQHFVSCSNEDAAIVMYDVYTGKEILSFFGHEDTIISAAFSQDSKFLATTSRDNTMILWDAVIGQQISVFDHEKVVICCCFSRDGKYLVSGCQDKICRKWDIRKRREVLAYAEHEGIIVSVAYSPDGETVCSAAADKTLRIWNATTAVTIRVLTGHKGIVLSCNYAQDGARIVSNDENVLKVWDVSSGDCLTSLDVNDIPHIDGSRNNQKKLAWTLTAYAPQQFGFYIIGVCNDRVVHIFHPLTGEEIVAFYSKAPVYCLSSGSSSKLAYGDSYGNIYIVNLR